MVKDYYDIRAVFKKTDRAVFISHLDLMRVMQRSFKRAKLPVWFTKGYNPHIYLMFPLPLSLGVASECEIMDFGINISSGEPNFDDIKERLNKALPLGIEVIELYIPTTKHTDISACEYEIEFVCEKPASKIKELFESFLAQNEILIQKRAKVNMKKTLVTKDIKPDITLLEITEREGNMAVSLRLPSGIVHSLNVVAVTEAFSSYCGFEFDKLCIKRTKILSENGVNFR